MHTLMLTSILSIVGGAMVISLGSVPTLIIAAIAILVTNYITRNDK